MQQALRAADTALGRLEETLQVRLLEEGRLQIRRSPVQLGTVVREAVSTLESVAKRKKVSVSRAVTGAAVAAVDETLLRRSIENLLTNALKYTPSGGDVAVAVHGGEEALEIEVSDRGPGVPDDLKTTLFEKFSSVEAKKGQARRGFGLGLYLVKLVAEGHGGAVSVLDRPGGGSVFRLTLGMA